MKRTLVLMSIELFMISLIIAQRFWIAFIFVPIFLLLTKKKHKLIMLIFIVSCILSASFIVSKTDDYLLRNTTYNQVEILSYKNDYVLETDDGFRLLVKNDLDTKLYIGRYGVKYNRNVYFNQNPNVFNYKNYLLSMGFVDVVKLSEIELVYIKKGKKIDSFRMRTYHFIKNRIEIIYDNSLTESLVKSLILADKSGIDDDVMASFVESGTSHVLAISGLHIGLFYMMFQLPFFMLGNPKKYFAVMMVFIFLWLIGFPYSGARALCLILGTFISFHFKRPYDMLQTLSVIAIILMFKNPYIIYHSGFQYSFCALIIISVLYKPIFSNIKNKYLALLCMSLTLQVGLMPLTVYHQLQIHLLSFLANLIVIPLMTVVLYLSSITLIMPLKILILYLDVLIEWVIKINSLFEGLNFFKISMMPWPIWLVISFYFLLMLYNERVYRAKLTFIMCLMITSSLIYSQVAVEIYYLDVGQGDCILIKHKNKVTLIDGGPYSESGLLLDVLKRNRIDCVDNIFISHSHHDHIGGLLNISSLTKSANWYFKSGNEKDSYFQMLYKHKSYNTDVYHEITLKGINVSIVPYKSREALNNASMVMELGIYHMSFLFTGDMEDDVESEIYMNLPRVDVLKVPHHGSNTSSSQEFISVTNPSLAVICVGKNFYGHPNGQVVNRYKASGAEVRLTRDGYVKIIVLPFNIHWISRL